jgi:flagellar basal-body rod modification protein FlgD
MEITQTSAQGFTAPATGGATEALGKDQFLRLLTAQLNNQDPLNPMDNTAFVAQLAQFSGLEQMLNISQSIDQLALAQAVANGANMVSFIGKEISWSGDAIQVDGPGQRDLAIDLEGDATEVTVTVYDKQGKLVKTIEAGPMDAGDRAVPWDGTDEQGRPVANGEYTFKVSARGPDGERVEVSTRQRGKVDGVTYASGYPELVVNGQRVAVGQVVEVLEPGTSSTTSDDTIAAPKRNPRAKEAYEPPPFWARK